MKKTIYSIFILGLTISSITTSCNADDRNTDISANVENQKVLSKEAVKNASLDKKLQYKKYYLQEAGKLIKKLGITTNDLINLSINAESKGQQEKTFLLVDVISLAKSKNVIMDATISQKISDLEDAFKGLDDKNYNISIYIPFAEKTKLNANKAGTANNDIYIIEEEDRSDIEYFEGYVLNEDGNYVSYQDLINEEMAEDLSEQGRNVAIIGLQDTSYNPGNGNGGNTTYTDKNFKFGTMTVKSHKESWTAGASDIAMQMYKYENGNLQKIDFINEPNSGGQGGAHNYFAKFKRKEIKNQTEKGLYMAVAGMIKTDPAIFANSKFYYSIYETDNWPTTHRVNKFILPNGQELKIYFGSSDGEYFNSNAIGNSFPLSSNQLNNNSEIKFISYLQ